MGTAPPSAKVIVESTAEAATDSVVALLKTILCEAVDTRGGAHVALAGGTTPHKLYQRLGESGMAGDLPWSKVEVFFGDERDVPQDHVESNFRMVQRTLLDHVPINWAKVHPMRADAEDIDAAAKEYEQIIRQRVSAEDNEIPRFDLVLLGVGADGHVASLFPGTDAVGEREKLVGAHFVPVLGRKRMTLTLPLINAARNIVFLVTGQDKAEAIAILLGERQSPQELPASLVAPDDGMLCFVLDSEAARYIQH